MIYVGIDVAKLNHFTSLIFSDRKSLLGRSNFQITVIASGISFPPSNHSTAKGSASVLNQRSLCRPLICYLVAEGYNIRVLNPPSTSSMHLPPLATLLAKTSQDHLKKEQAAELRALAQKSVGQFDQTLFTQITSAIAKIEPLDEQIARVEAEMTKIMFQ